MKCLPVSTFPEKWNWWPVVRNHASDGCSCTAPYTCTRTHTGDKCGLASHWRWSVGICCTRPSQGRTQGLQMTRDVILETGIIPQAHIAAEAKIEETLLGTSSKDGENHTLFCRQCNGFLPCRLKQKHFRWVVARPPPLFLLVSGSGGSPPSFILD